jgi:two-component system nitrate/nitrite response regulator NarL
MQTVAPASEVGAIDVAIAIGNEILGRGIEAVLGSLPAVATARICTRPEELGALLRTTGLGTTERDTGGRETTGPGGTNIDVVIVSAFETEWLAKLTGPSAKAGVSSGRVTGPGGGPLVLLLVDESALSDPQGYASMPVDGFLSQQDLDADTLSDALTRCRLGDVPMPPALARALLARADDPAPRRGTRVANLTSREIEALTLLVRGMSNKQIARQLQISSHGAKRLVASIMLKLDSPNRTTAAVNAIKAGIVDYEGTVTTGHRGAAHNGAGDNGAGQNGGPGTRASNANGAGTANRHPGPHPNAGANGHAGPDRNPAADRANGYKHGPSRPPEMVGR